MNMSDKAFYKTLKSVDFFSEITNKANYTLVPDDWLVGR